MIRDDNNLRSFFTNLRKCEQEKMLMTVITIKLKKEYSNNSSEIVEELPNFVNESKRYRNISLRIWNFSDDSYRKLLPSLMQDLRNKQAFKSLEVEIRNRFLDII